MKYCNECGAKNEQDATMCSECNAPLAQEPQKKSGVSTKTIIALVAIIAVAAVAVFGGMQLFGNKKADNPLVNYEAQLEMMKGADIAMKMSLDFGDETPSDPSVAMMANMFKDAYINITSKHNLDATKMAFGFEVNAMGQSFINGDAIVDETGVLVNIPVVYQQPLFFGWDKLSETLKAQGETDFTITYDDVKAYLAVLDFENTEAFKALDMEAMSEKMLADMGTTLEEKGKEDVKVMVNGTEKTINTTVYDVKYNMENAMNLSQQMVKEVYGDPKMVAFIKDRFAYVVNVAETRGHLQGEDLLEAKALLEGTKFEDAINELIAEMDAQMAEQQEAINSAEMEQAMALMKDMKMTIYVDSDNVTRKQLVKMPMPAEAGIAATIVMEMTVNDFGKDVKVPSAQSDNSVDVLTLSEAEQMQLMQEIQMNIQSFVGAFGLGF